MPGGVKCIPRTFLNPVELLCRLFKCTHWSVKQWVGQRLNAF